MYKVILENLAGIYTWEYAASSNVEALKMGLKEYFKAEYNPEWDNFTDYHELKYAIEAKYRLSICVFYSKYFKEVL